VVEDADVVVAVGLGPVDHDRGVLLVGRADAEGVGVLLRVVQGVRAVAVDDQHLVLHQVRVDQVLGRAERILHDDGVAVADQLPGDADRGGGVALVVQVVHRDLVTADTAVRVEVGGGDPGDGLDEFSGGGRRPRERNDVVHVYRARGDVGTFLGGRRGTCSGR